MTDYNEQTDERPYEGPWVVCLFLVNQSYGGPEEGGWWYEYGEPMLTPSLRVFATREDARAYRRSLEPIETEMNRGRPPLSSVRSDGVFEFHVCEGWPEAYPKRRPHYE